MALCIQIRIHHVIFSGQARMILYNFFFQHDSKRVPTPAGIRTSLVVRNLGDSNRGRSGYVN